MNDQFNDLPVELGPDLPVTDWGEFTDVPRHLDVLPNGSETLVIGDPEGCKDFNHKQGDNDLGFQNDCGLVSCQDVLRQFGILVTESDIVHHAVENGECQIADNPETSGGSSLQEQANLLTDYGIPAYAESGYSLEDLASQVEHGHGTIAAVNSGALWNDPGSYDNGEPNHAITITGVARDPYTNQIQGFYINDSAPPESAEFVKADAMEIAWLPYGIGGCLVTGPVLPHIPTV
jgi:Peptidase_C39 like family